MSCQKILVVDDDVNLLELLKIRLESSDYEVVTASDEEKALNRMREHIINLAVVDLQLDSKDGIVLMKELHAINPEMPVIILTAYGSIDSAVEAIKMGAYNYLTKPFDHRELLLQIENALKNTMLTREIKRLQGLLSEKYDFRNIIGKSAKMQSVLEQVSLVSQTDSTVFIHGESGTGKELIAKTIHLASSRKDHPFLAINCAAIPETLLESELFGYEKGAFTGAFKSSGGLLVQADKGTVFLDEIGDMPLATQVKLLRFLQERQFYPVGSLTPVEVDVRVVVATNKDLKAMMEEGTFREDLFYRIHVIPILIPPLRERKEDIPMLVEHFLKKLCQQTNKVIQGVSHPAMQKLMLHDWPGNVRELENTIEYAVAMSRYDILTEDLVLPSSPSEPLQPLRESKAKFERKYLISLLELTRGNVSKAAQLAGKYRADLYNLLKKYNIRPEDFKKF